MVCRVSCALTSILGGRPSRLGFSSKHPDLGYQSYQSTNCATLPHYLFFFKWENLICHTTLEKNSQHLNNVSGAAAQGKSMFATEETPASLRQIRNYARILLQLRRASRKSTYLSILRCNIQICSRSFSIHLVQTTLVL